jgi:hypothetical protein
MIKINYLKPEENESIDEIAIYNIKLSDKFKNLQSFCQASLAWLKNDSKRNYQDLEKLLRELNLDTHLIAKQLDTYKDSDKFKLCIPNRETQPEDLKYVLLVSCRSKSDALKELGLHQTSYEENFTCLNKTGCFVDINIASNNESFSYSSLENSNENQILKSALKYDFVSVSGREAVEVVIKDLFLKYEKEPEKIVCGKLGERDIWGLKLNGELASPIGWIEIEVENKNENEYQLIDFRMIKQINKQ